MNHASMALGTDQGPETLSTNELARRETASSVGSNLYKPLPTGRWLLECHASCPRCHHYHSAATLKIDNQADERKISPVLCENCKEPWVTFGSCNSTQLSLLSVLTTVPDPVEREVHRALIAMVRSMTAVATPHLARDLQTATYDAAPTTSPIYGLQDPIHEPPGADQDIFHVPVTVPKSQWQHTWRSKLVVGSISGPSKPDTTRPSFFHLRKKIVTRFPILHRVASIASQRRARTPEKVDGSAQDTSQIFMDRAPASAQDSASTQHKSSHRDQTGPTDALALSHEAQDFITKIQDDLVSSMSQEDCIRWAREKLTEFRFRRASTALLEEPFSIDRVSPSSSNDLRQMQVTQLDRPRSIDHLLGSHSGLFDGVYFTAPPAHRESMSGRTSEVTTVVGDGVFGPRIPFQGLIPRERRSSGASRPLSAQSAPRTWQQVQQIRSEARYSQEVASAMTAVRDVPGARARNSHRL